MFFPSKIIARPKKHRQIFLFQNLSPNFEIANFNNNRIFLGKLTIFHPDFDYLSKER